MVHATDIRSYRQSQSKSTPSVSQRWNVEHWTSIAYQAGFGLGFIIFLTSIECRSPWPLHTIEIDETRLAGAQCLLYEISVCRCGCCRSWCRCEVVIAGFVRYEGEASLVYMSPRSNFQPKYPGQATRIEHSPQVLRCDSGLCNIQER